ncbi:MAG: nucleoside transporter, partial [Candidatus Dadabacteria bacterium]|nr:nucleoside transporter [Candidatus Dadabacteria bacterium]
MGINNLVSFLGIFILLAVAWAISTNRRNVNFRVVIWAIVVQLILGAFVFQVPAGTKVFLYVNDIVIKVLNSATAGAEFLFGRLALPPGQKNPQGEESLGFFLAFQGLPTIIFFSSLMSVLYFYKIMPRVIKAFAYVFTRLMRISGAESLSAASNIFVGVESTLTIQPYLGRMTRSELCTVLTAGMATVSSNIMAVYVYSLQGEFPTIA